LGRGSHIELAQTHAWLMELNPAIQVGQGEMKPRIALGTSFKMEIPLHEHWLSQPMILQSSGLQSLDGCISGETEKEAVLLILCTPHCCRQESV
jgi:hypothetical protein